MGSDLDSNWSFVKRLSLWGILLSMLFFFEIACRTPPQPEICTGFFSRSRTDADFERLSLEDQFMILRCELQGIPGTGAYSIAISKRGKKIVPFLLRKLSEDSQKSRSEKDLTTLAVAMVFHMLAVGGDLEDERYTVRILEKSVSAMEFDAWRGRELLTAIKVELRKKKRNQ